MPKDKDRALNPAAAQRKAEKQRALKKGKAAVTAQRNERLAHRNPDRLQRQIDERKELESSRGSLSQRDKSTLADLERDVARIRKAKEALGDKGPPGRDREREQRRDGRPEQVLGKRRRFDGQGRRSRSSSSSATDDDVRDIPMPRDTPPPVPSRRRPNRGRDDRDRDDRGVGRGEEGALQGRPSQAAREEPAAPRLVYESKAVVRDLQREAAGFVPNVVKRKLEAVKGGMDQPLMEEEELDRLEKEGYGKSGQEREDRDKIQADSGGADRDLDEELSRFSNEVKHVQVEEVEDEEA